MPESMIGCPFTPRVDVCFLWNIRQGDRCRVQWTRSF